MIMAFCELEMPIFYRQGSLPGSESSLIERMHLTASLCIQGLAQHLKPYARVAQS